MAMFEIEAESSIIDVVFAPDNSNFWVLHHGGITAYTLGTEGNRCLAPKLLQKAPLSAAEEIAALQVAASREHGARILTVAEEEAAIIAAADLLSTKPDGWMANKVDAGSVSSMGPFTVGDRSSIFAQEHSGRLLEVSAEGSLPLPVSFPTFLPWAEFAEHDGELLAFGLSEGGHLYVNSRQLVKNCTSFLVTPSHLIFTTSNHLLKFAHLASPEGMISKVSFYVRQS